MRGMFFAAVAAAILLTGGCTASTRSGVGAVAGSDVQDPVVREVRAHCDALLADARIDPVRSKIQLPLSFDSPQAIDYLSDRTYPTPDESLAIQALWEARTGCRRFGEARLGPMPNFRAESEDALVDLLGDLREGAITYGQFARKVLHVGARDKHARELLDEAQRARDMARLD